MITMIRPATIGVMESLWWIVFLPVVDLILLSRMPGLPGRRGLGWGGGRAGRRVRAGAEAGGGGAGAGRPGGGAHRRAAPRVPRAGQRRPGPPPPLAQGAAEGHRTPPRHDPRTVDRGPEW